MQVGVYRGYGVGLGGGPTASLGATPSVARSGAVNQPGETASHQAVPAAGRQSNGGSGGQAASVTASVASRGGNPEAVVPLGDDDMKDF